MYNQTKDELAKPRAGSLLEPHLNQVTLKKFQRLAMKGEVHVILRNPKRTGNLTIRSYNDSETGEMMTFVDTQGRQRIYNVTKKIVLKLTNENDRLLYLFIKEHEYYTRASNAPLKIVSIEEEADKFVKETENAMDAGNIIKKLAGEELKNFARVVLPSSKKLTISAPINDSTSDQVVKKYLYEIAKADAEHIVKEWNDEKRPFREVLRKAILRKVVIENRGVFSFNGDRIGVTFEQAVEWLKDNQDMVRVIENKYETVE